MKKKPISIRLSEKDIDLLKALSKQMQLSQADTVSKLLNDYGMNKDTTKQENLTESLKMQIRVYVENEVKRILDSSMQKEITTNKQSNIDTFTNALNKTDNDQNKYIKKVVTSDNDLLMSKPKYDIEKLIKHVKKNDITSLSNERIKELINMPQHLHQDSYKFKKTLMKELDKSSVGNAYQIEPIIRDKKTVGFKFTFK